MEKNWKLSRALHVSKLQLGFLATLIIAGSFIAVLFGFFKVQLGYQGHSTFINSTLVNRPVDVDNNGETELIAYTNRERKIDLEDNRSYGFTDQNGIVVFGATNGVPLWSFSVNRSRFVVNMFEYITEGNYSDSVAPIAFAQFAEVQDQETISFNHSDEITYRRNETGKYQTYLLDLSNTTAPVFRNLTALLPGRVEAFMHLPYNPVDSMPDFLVLRSNATLEMKWQANVTYMLHAFFANGTLAWISGDHDPASPLYPFDDFTYEWFSATMLNRSHAVIKTPTGGLAAFSIIDKTVAWKVASFSSVMIDNVLSTGIDYTGDGAKDIAIKYFNGTSHGMAIRMIDGSNGSLIDSIAVIELRNDTRIAEVRNKDRFNLGQNSMILAWSQNLSELTAYEFVQSGIASLFSTDLAQLGGENFREPNTNDVFFFGDHVYYPQAFSLSGRGVICVFDLQDGTIQGPYQDYGESQAFGEISPSWTGMEIAGVSGRDEIYRIIVLESRNSLFALTPTNTIVFITSIIVATCAAILMIRVQSRRKKLILEEKNAGVARDDAMERSIKSIRGASITPLVVLIVASTFFIWFIFVQNTDTMINDSADFVAIRAAYFMIVLMFSSLPLIGILYNHFSPWSAMFYVKVQNFVFSKLKGDKFDYRLLVLDMSHGKRYSVSSLVSRSLFPMLVSLTVGFYMFQMFGTHSVASATGEISLPWLGEFEIIAGTSFIVTYIVLLFLIPGAWLLDDAGIVYFNQAKDYLASGDISKISDWLLSMLKGVFGFTALLNYYSMFSTLNLSTAGNMDDPLASILLVVFIIIILVILSPILYGLMAMFFGNASLASDLGYNKRLLLEKLAKRGIDTTPRRIQDIFAPR
nr:hypothetical protein [Candidatus Sigynarchaeota archaeon]